MESTISQQIAELPAKDKAQLSKLWVEHFGKQPPSHLRKQLMVPLLAYRIQEKEYGGLSHISRQKLRTLAVEFGSEKPTRPRTETAQAQGTRLLRSWRGEMHEVNVLDGAFEYRGRTYSSLSKIASEITGTRWSGPLFFGTKQTK